MSNINTCVLMSLAYFISSFCIFFPQSTTAALHGGGSVPVPVPGKHGSVVTVDQRRVVVSTEFGEISTVKVSDGKEGFYDLQFITLEPNSLFVPVHLHSDMVFYVNSGSGTLSWVDFEKDKGKLRQVDLRTGDVYRLPIGSFFYLQSNLDSDRRKFRINAIFSDSRETRDGSSFGAYSSVVDLLMGFDDTVLQAALNVDEAVIQELRSGGQQQMIVHGVSKVTKLFESHYRNMRAFLRLIDDNDMIKVNKDKKGKAYNILEAKPDFENCNGWSLIVTSKQMDALTDSDFGIFMVNLTKGAMMGPHWNPLTAEIAVVLSGRGMVHVVCPSSLDEAECKNSRFRVEEGDVFVVPRYHPMAQISFNNGSFVFMGFTTTQKNNHPQYLVGSASVFQVLNKRVLAASLGVSNTTMDELLSAQNDAVILECTSCAEEEERLMEEEIERQKEEEAREREEEERKREEEEEARRQEEEARREEEEEARREEEEARKREEEAARREEEEARKREEEEAARREEEEARKREEEQEAKRRQEEEEAARKREEEAARQEQEIRGFGGAKLGKNNQMENNDNQNPDKNNPSTSSFVIKIPSYEEVIQSSQSKPLVQSLFNPQSFTQAFNSIKNSEFYVPPPPPPSSSSQSQSSTSRESSTPSSLPSAAANHTGAPSSSNLNRNAILVSHRQKGNPLLKHIRNVRWAFSDIVCDYMLGKNSCALYLSLRYHLLHPDYLFYRIRELGKNFKLRVILCHVDVEDVVKPLLEVTRTALLHDCTLLCGWSLEECGRYLETIKVYENKPADLIQGQMDTDYLSRLSHALTSVRHVNKTDVVTLGSTFGSLSHIMDASMEDLARCPGIGERKVKRLYDTFHEPFKRAIPKHPSTVESSVQQFTPTDVKEDEKDVARSSKRDKKESNLTVKSALSAAFAKYKEKVGVETTHQQEHENQKQ